MQSDKANRLRQSTTDEQKKSCEHSYEKEYFLGASTGDYVCTKCGDFLIESKYLQWQEGNKKD